MEGSFRTQADYGVGLPKSRLYEFWCHTGLFLGHLTHRGRKEHITMENYYGKVSVWPGGLVGIRFMRSYLYTFMLKIGTGTPYGSAPTLPEILNLFWSSSRACVSC